MSGPDESPEVPGLRTWRAVYVFALVCFAAYVVLLTALTHLFP